MPLHTTKDITQTTPPAPPHTNRTLYELRDPDGVMDYISMSLVGASSLFYVAVGILTFLKRNAKPMRAKDVPLCIICTFSAICIAVMSIFEYQVIVFPPSSFLVYTCGWQSPIFTTSLGMLTFLNCLLARLIRLLVVFKRPRLNRSKVYTSRAFILALLQIPNALLLVASLALQSDYYSAADGTCIQMLWFNIAQFVILVITFGSFLTLAFVLRDIPKEFNEYRVTVLSLAMSCIALVFLIIVQNILSIQITTSVWGRNISSLLLALLPFVYIMLFILKPLVLCIIYGKKYEDRWFRLYQEECCRRVTAKVTADQHIELKTKIDMCPPPPSPTTTNRHSKASDFEDITNQPPV